VLTAAAARSRGIDGGEEALDAAAATRMSRCGEDQPHFDASGDLFEVKSLPLSVQTRFTNLAFPPEHWPRSVSPCPPSASPIKSPLPPHPHHRRELPPPPSQVERILRVNGLSDVTAAVVEAARESLGNRNGLIRNPTWDRRVKGRRKEIVWAPNRALTLPHKSATMSLSGKDNPMARSESFALVLLLFTLGGCTTQTSGSPLNDLAATNGLAGQAGQSLITDLKTAASNLDAAVSAGDLAMDDPGPPCLHAVLQQAGIEAAAGSTPSRPFTAQVDGVISAGSILYIRFQQEKGMLGAGSNLPTACKALVGQIVIDGATLAKAIR